MKYPDGSRHIVYAGGDPDYYENTYIYDLDSGIDIWRPGPKFEFYDGASVQFGDTFLLVGGRQNVFPFSASDQIWQFNPDPSDESWVLRPETLKSAKYHTAAFLVPNDYATC